VKSDDRLKHRAPRIVAASLIMGAALWAAQIALGPVFELSRMVATLLLIALGIAGYFGTAQLIGAVNLRDLKASVKRG